MKKVNNLNENVYLITEIEDMYKLQCFKQRAMAFSGNDPKMLIAEAKIARYSRLQPAISTSGSSPKKAIAEDSGSYNRLFKILINYKKYNIL